MRYVWEDCDIIVGRQIQARNRAETYIIGYDPTAENQMERSAVVSLRDGMILKNGLSRESLVEYLNLFEYKPVDLRLPDIATAGART